MATASLTLIQRQIRAARDKSVPLVVVKTVDPAACVRSIEPIIRDGDDRPAPFVQWTSVHGFQAVTAASTAAVKAIGQVSPTAPIISPVEALIKAANAPDNTAIAFLNLNDFWADPRVRQAFWSLRDALKQNFRTAIVMGNDVTVPIALEHDVHVVDEPLPGPSELADIIRTSYGLAASVKVPLTEDILQRATDAVAGLSAFAVEQAVSLSITPRGLDMNALRSRHRSMIENTKGLSVWSGGETFEQVGGLRAFIAFARRLLGAGVYRPGAVLWVDEIEKALAGIAGDLTGISQDYLATLLGYMQNGNVPGILLMGHPGTGKSLLAKAFGASAGVPTINVDLGAMHGQLVGQSQGALRHALKVSTAVSQGRPIVIATCNSVAVLPPELVNRFPWRFFVDLPSDEEKKTIWPIQLAAFKLDARQPKPTTPSWNGREIKQCCETAALLKCSLLEAADMVVPVAMSARDEIEKRRSEADARYLSASTTGPYIYNRNESVTVGNVTRKIRVEDDPKWVAPASDKLN